MAFKINIADKSGKTYKLELETEEFIGKSLHDKISGKELLADLSDYEFELTGASDKSGFTAHEDVQGTGTKKILLTYGKAMKKKPRREGKKKQSNPKPKGLRLRKTVRGSVVSPEIIQINLKIIKQGAKKISDIFPDQNKAKEPEAKPEEKPIEKSTEQPQSEAPKQEPIKEEKAPEPEAKPEEKPAEQTPSKESESK